MLASDGNTIIFYKEGGNFKQVDAMPAFVVRVNLDIGNFS